MKRSEGLGWVPGYDLFTVLGMCFVCDLFVCYVYFSGLGAAKNNRLCYHAMGYELGPPVVLFWGGFPD